VPPVRDREYEVRENRHELSGRFLILVSGCAHPPLIGFERSSVPPGGIARPIRERRSDDQEAQMSRPLISLGPSTKIELVAQIVARWDKGDLAWHGNDR
jgi:hypothetical protein